MSYINVGPFNNIYMVKPVCPLRSWVSRPGAPVDVRLGRGTNHPFTIAGMLTNCRKSKNVFSACDCTQSSH